MPRLRTGQFAGMTVTLESRIPQIIAVAEAETQGATLRTAQLMVRVAKDRSRVESGSMKGGWQYRKAPQSKTYEVFNPVTHTVFNEYGTIYMAAQPMLTPAMEVARMTYPAEIRGIWAQLASGTILHGRISKAESLNPGSTFA